jgi:eukaryotic-like serine/threonine-protein kinase
MSQTRRLAAIMFTDIVGYTAMMGEDEKKAFELLKKNRKLQKPLIEEFGGVWVKELGDGVLATFPTVIDAVSSACLIQKAVGIEGMRLRIGIHLGDVIFENNDVFGDSVNVAARIQALAPIGGIYITESVHKNISNKKGIKSTYVQNLELKNVKEPVPVYEIDIDSFTIDKSERYRTNTAGMQSEFTSRKTSYKRLAAWGIPVLALGLLAAFLVPPYMEKQNARNVILPEIRQLAENKFPLLISTKAFELAMQASKVIPGDTTLERLMPVIAQKIDFISTPSGADLYWKSYSDAKEEWKLLGTTPLTGVLFPRGFTRIKYEKKGFTTLYTSNTPAVRKVTLDSIGKYPEDMVKVNSGEANMNIVGLEQHAGRPVGEFLMDRYEVTNKQFRQFVDAGGYKDRKFWDYPFENEKGNISWEEAMKLFVDKTGRPGPSSWEAGTYPDGKADHPVTGVSWYEAMAFAKFAGKQLPTVYHWSQVANTYNTWGIIPKSNFSGTGTVSVGSMDGISTWGVFDIAGNAREWCYNESNRKAQRFILGGGWNDPTYAFNDGYLQYMLDRSPTNGFRCMKELPGDTTIAGQSGLVSFDFRDYTKEKPVDDNTFNIFLRQYNYDHSPLNADVTLVSDSGDWKVEKIEMDAAYNKERFTAFLYSPKNGTPPYQAIVFWPGSGVIFERKFDVKKNVVAFDYLLKSGRAVLYPVLKSTFERGDELVSDLQNETKFYKDHVIFWTQDIRRSIDYLETRNDIVKNNFGYYGYSWGSAEGPIACVTDPRFKAAFFHVGGLLMQKTLPEVDPLNFLTRLKIPVLMLNGKNDTFFPVETSQKPMFNLLGTPEKDKKIIIYEGGHLVPKAELMKESLIWYDKYLGAVK